jgi:hypothetical protein
MVMMSPDGVTSSRAARARTRHASSMRTLQLVKVIPVDIAPEHLAFSPDGRWSSGQSGRRFDLGD